MRAALKDVPEKQPNRPDGLLAIQLQGSGRQEFIYRENLPPEPLYAPELPPDLTPAAESPEEAVPYPMPPVRTVVVEPAPVFERSATPVRR
jgi:penicillin-binding protein 1A